MAFKNVDKLITCLIRIYLYHKNLHIYTTGDNKKKNQDFISLLFCFQIIRVPEYIILHEPMEKLPQFYFDNYSIYSLRMSFTSTVIYLCIIQIFLSNPMGLCRIPMFYKKRPFSNLYVSYKHNIIKYKAN